MAGRGGEDDVAIERAMGGPQRPRQPVMGGQREALALRLGQHRVGRDEGDGGVLLPAPPLKRSPRFVGAMPPAAQSPNSASLS